MSAPTSRNPHVRGRILRLAGIALLFPLNGNHQSFTPAAALALEQQGKLEEAATAWRSITRRNPRDAAAFASLGVVLAKQKKYPDAAIAYKKPSLSTPSFPASTSTWASPNSNKATSRQPSPHSRLRPRTTPLAPSPASCWA